MKFSHLQNPNPDHRKICFWLIPDISKILKKIPSEFPEGMNNQKSGIKII